MVPFAAAWLASAIILSFLGFVALSKNQKDVVYRRLGLRRQASSRPSTPSLEKQAPSKPLASVAADLVLAFPPSPRGQLSKMVGAMPAAQRAAMGDLSFDEKKFPSSLLGFDENYATADDGKYNYTGFSVRELKALGDFPDYATLSEVPMPQPYPEFDIDRALPRPYRPFRWAYHQTMCK